MHAEDRAAIAHAAMAVLANPDNPAPRQDLAKALYGRTFGVYHPALRDALALCLDDPGIDPQDLCPAWYELLYNDPAFRPVWDLSEQGDYQTFKKNFYKLKDRRIFLDPLFLLGLRRLVLPDLSLEIFIGNLRRLLAEDAEKLQATFTSLTAALAEYCFFVNYIFDETGTEKNAILARAGSGYPYDIALCACYAPLYKRPDAAALQEKYKRHDMLGPLIKRQVTDPLEEKEIARSIPRLTPVQDKISQDVQAQYDEFPYPCWQSVPRNFPVPAALQKLRDKPLEILVAGCGTGREALTNALAFPNAHVLAVDLSTTSLSYAIRKTRECGATHIAFAQADILALGSLGKQFDYISSSGVLHHMEKPEAGFAALTGLLKPGGYFALALYSETGRRHIAAAHEAIRKNNYPGTTEGIKKFRRDCTRLLSPEAAEGIMQAQDFFILYECRDLLFHVMEHRYDLPALRKLLDKFNLEFAGFRLPAPVLEFYARAFPEDAAKTNLENWHLFEQSHPDTFAAMYKFLCRKKS